ncbi:MAG: hypothetical protein ABI870_10445 [Rhodanobacter sp.]
MNTFLRYSLLDKCMSALLASFATVSIAFGLCWALQASLLLHV